ncbi:MAG: hypothetical protein CM15mP120_13170 [Pseudomonadota bacterium]|nr:MAG: hypothetical protein CM15mP120_13170 [Pseudomonadota bacterium]
MVFAPGSNNFYIRGIDMVFRDTLRDPEAYRELLQGGGRGMVPCLRIERGDEVEWMYESMDIIRYLDAQFENSL